MMLGNGIYRQLKMLEIFVFESFSFSGQCEILLLAFQSTVSLHFDPRCDHLRRRHSQEFRQ